MERDPMVLYHRTYRDSSQQLVGGFDARRDVFEPTCVRRAFKFVGMRALETVIFPKPDQDFDTYATEWETGFTP